VDEDEEDSTAGAGTSPAQWIETDSVGSSEISTEGGVQLSDCSNWEAETVPEAPVQSGSGIEGSSNGRDGTVKAVSSSSSSSSSPDDDELDDSDSATGSGFQWLDGSGRANSVDDDELSEAGACQVSSGTSQVVSDSDSTGAGGVQMGDEADSEDDSSSSTDSDDSDSHSTTGEEACHEAADSVVEDDSSTGAGGWKDGSETQSPWGCCQVGMVSDSDCQMGATSMTDSVSVDSL